MISSEHITHTIQLAIPGCDIRIEGQDCNFQVVVISETFSGQGLLQRQQRVLKLFEEPLRRGELHALTVKALTPDQYQQQNQPVTLQGL